MIEGLQPDGCEFLFVFDAGAFSGLVPCNLAALGRIGEPEIARLGSGGHWGVTHGTIRRL